MSELIQLGINKNWRQFALLVLINGFVGSLAGMERSIMPELAREEFQISDTSFILFFIAIFGITKAFANYFMGAYANKFGRKNLLIAGWIIGLPAPLILLYATNWYWVIAANVLIGVNQGLAWSAAITMKIDLAGENKRGLAMGLNEFAGYIAVGAMALITGYIAGTYGVKPYPFYLGFALCITGLLLTVFFVKDTHPHVKLETVNSTIPKLKNIFWDTTLFNRNLGSVTQAGIVNNMNDGMLWGLLPILLASKSFTLSEIGIIVSIYPAVWGIVQLITGTMADHICKKSLLFWGMLLQSISIGLLIFASTFMHFVILSILIGIGTAMVYPTFLATVAENSNPVDRAKSLGVFRLWRDLGYAFGAVLTGFIADATGLKAPVYTIAVLTFLSSLVIQFRMRCTVRAIKIPEWILSKFRFLRVAD